MHTLKYRIIVIFVNLSSYSWKEIWTNVLCHLESLDLTLQNYLFKFFRFCFIVEKINFFPISLAKPYKTVKIVFLFNLFHHESSSWEQNKQHIRNQRQKLHQIQYILAKLIFSKKLTRTPPQHFFFKTFPVGPPRAQWGAFA